MAQNPTPSQLDPGQIIKRSFDGAEDRLRVDAQVTAVIPGPIEVSITDVDDSIRIGGGGPGPYLNVNPDGSLNVVVTSGTPATYATNVNYSEISAVAAAVETTILTYTVPAATTTSIVRADVSGTNIALYAVKVNSAAIAKRRTWWTSFNEKFEFTTNISNGYTLSAGDVVTITVLHNSASLGNFNASLERVQIT